MILEERIERVFAARPMPAEIVDVTNRLQVDSDVEEALWFEGRDWHNITWKDWEEHFDAIYFFSPDAFVYFLPSILLLSSQNPTKPLMVANSLIGQLDRSPTAEGWTEEFANRFLALKAEELGLLKEWLLVVCEYVPYKRWGIAASGAGDTFGRAFDTVALIQNETERRMKEVLKRPADTELG